MHTSHTPVSQNKGVPAVGGVIQTRFGDVTVDAGKTVQFARGLLGMPDKQQFALVNFPNEKMQQFTLLQSLDDAGLSFIALPLGLDNNILAAADIRQAGLDLQIAEANLAVLLIVTVHRNSGQVRLSVNARAPIFIDASRQAGVQYVFQSEQYKVQHML